jgi:hypothetical protein
MDAWGLAEERKRKLGTFQVLGVAPVVKKRRRRPGHKFSALELQVAERWIEGVRARADSSDTPAES